MQIAEVAAAAPAYFTSFVLLGFEIVIISLQISNAAQVVSLVKYHGKPQLIRVLITCL